MNQCEICSRTFKNKIPKNHTQSKLHQNNLKKRFRENIQKQDEKSDCTTQNESSSNKLRKKQQLVNDIFQPDTNGVSGWKSRDELSQTELSLSNNGNGRYGKFFNDTRFIWETKKEKNKVISLRTIGFDTTNNDNINKRSIRKDIKEYHYTMGCVSCGSKNDLVIDHKNDLYNDPRALNIATQSIHDFQCLCRHCNLQKRQVCVNTKKYNKRYGATNIPKLKCFGIDFIEGDETFDPKDVYALKGTYWYDPVVFMEYIKDSFTK